MTKRKKDKRTNNDLQNTTHKTKVRETRTALKTGGELRMVSNTCKVRFFHMMYKYCAMSRNSLNMYYNTSNI
jgi:hypothetical protein